MPNTDESQTARHRLRDLAHNLRSTLLRTLGRWLLPFLALLLIGFVVWSAAKWLPDSVRPIAGIVLGWVLGLLSAPLVEALKSAQETRQIARILHSELGHNIDVVRFYIREHERHASLSGLPLDAQRRPTVRPPLRNQFRTTVFNATLAKHGLLTARTIQNLHEAYWHFGQIELLRTTWEENSNDSYAAHDSLKAIVQEAKTAANICAQTQLLAALQDASDRRMLDVLLGASAWR